MPEGDTIARTAATLHQWLAGRGVTKAWARNGAVDLARLVGACCEGAEARGKHLLLHFDNDMTLRTHMRMTGSWHVYPSGARWRKPRAAARLVIEASERVAVGFDIPVVELDLRRRVEQSRALTTLGPDVLADVVDLDQVRQRARCSPSGRALGEVLLDQHVVAGIGNIWRCEALFATRLSPWAPLGDVTDAAFDRVVRAASAFMRASVRARGSGIGERLSPAVYGRTGRPCRACNSLIAARPQGALLRVAYWCPRCQPFP